MSRKLICKIQVELEQMDLLMKRHPGLIDKCHHESPNNIEIDALSSFLHAFYTGIENIFKRISLEMDGGFPESKLWHARLLENMSQSTKSRPAVISSELRIKLRGYMDFRHLFRHAYTFQLKWNKMSGLVLELESI